MTTAQAKELVEASSPDLVRISLEGGVLLQRSGLQFPRNIPFQQWEALGQQILAVSESSIWWVADWLVYGEASFQERYLEAIRRTSLKYQTLRNYAWVARRFSASRRREQLSFGHHAEVAALDEPEQDYWLRKAEVLNWSRNQLRREIRNSLLERETNTGSPSSDRRPPGQRHSGVDNVQRPPGTTVEELSLKIPAQQLEQFVAAARCRNLTLDNWALQVLAAAAQKMHSTSA